MVMATSTYLATCGPCKVARYQERGEIVIPIASPARQNYFGNREELAMTKITTSAALLVTVTATAFALSGCPPPPNADSTSIYYTQVGACNGWSDGDGLHSAGPYAAYVIFKVSRVNNEGSARAFQFDPERLFTSTNPPAYMHKGLQLPLGPLELVLTNIPARGLQGLNGFIGARVETTTHNGAVEANETRYLLNYKLAPGDPGFVLPVNENLGRTSWPLTENCLDIQL